MPSALSALDLSYLTLDAGSRDYNFNSGSVSVNVRAEDIFAMLANCPVNRAALELKTLRSSAIFGEYEHSDRALYSLSGRRYTISEWVRSNFETMEGSLIESLTKMMRQFYALGYACAEIVWTNDESGYYGEWRLKRLNVLDLDKYHFRADGARVSKVVYSHSDGREIEIPISKILHIYNPQIKDPNNPLGDSAAARAYPYYKARQSILNEWAKAAKRQATGTTVIKADANSTVALLDARGNPIRKPDGSPQTESLLLNAVKHFVEAENGAIAGVDKSVDVQSFPSYGGENFFNLTAGYFQKMIYLAYGVPSTIFDDTASGIGNSGVNAGHRLILDSQIDAAVNLFRESLLEKVIRPLLTANFGRKFARNLGTFTPPKFLDPAMANSRAASIVTAASMGLLDINDINVSNRLREDLGIEPLSAEQVEQIAIAAYEQQQQQQELYAESEETPEDSAV